MSRKNKNIVVTVITSIIIIIGLESCSFQKYSFIDDKTDEIPLEIKIGQMIIVGFAGETKNAREFRQIKRYCKKGLIGGVFFGQNNIIEKESLLKMTSRLNSLTAPMPVFISIDQEGGYVSRLNNTNGFETYPTPYDMGLSKNDNRTIAIYREMSQLLSDSGFNLNFAPSVDLNINTNSPAIGALYRSFSDNPETVCHISEIFIDSHREYNIITAIKHFPGHGSAEGDTHLNMTDITETWNFQELTPFRYIIDIRKADMVMCGHLIQTNIDKIFPASLSYKWINDVLRDSLGYNGVVITDDILMESILSQYSIEDAILQSIIAGNDILLFTSLYYDGHSIPEFFLETVLNAIEDGIITEEQIDESFKRIKKLKQELAE